MPWAWSTATTHAFLNRLISLVAEDCHIVCLVLAFTVEPEHPSTASRPCGLIGSRRPSALGCRAPRRPSALPVDVAESQRQHPPRRMPVSRAAMIIDRVR